MEDFVRAASASELPDGEMMLVEVGDERILLSKVDGEIYAINEVCPHADGSLTDGLIEGDEVECPLHGSLFNLKTGENTGPPASENLARYAVRVEGDDVFVGPA